MHLQHHLDKQAKCLHQWSANPKPRCSLQDLGADADHVSGQTAFHWNAPESGARPGSFACRQGSSLATSSGYRGTALYTRDLPPTSSGGTRCAVGAGTPMNCKSFGLADSETVGIFACNGDTVFLSCLWLAREDTDEFARLRALHITIGALHEGGGRIAPVILR